MLNSTVLEVAIGLVFCYASVALIVSTINEGVASVLKSRARTLLGNVKQLLNDEKFTGLAKDLYNHVLVNPRGNGAAAAQKELKAKPSYIDSANFAEAMIDVLKIAPGQAGVLPAAVSAIQDPQIKSYLTSVCAKSAGDMDTLRMQLAKWFDGSMETMGGAYKRKTQLVCFLIGLALAVALNIDSIHMFKVLWEHPSLAAQLQGNSAMSTKDAMDQLNKLPIGWDRPFEGWMVAGWLITACSSIFGAPFWFDLLQRLTQLRGTGRKPDTANEKQDKGHGS
jgi:hypothetical protein